LQIIKVRIYRKNRKIIATKHQKKETNKRLFQLHKKEKYGNLYIINNKWCCSIIHYQDYTAFFVVGAMKYET